MDVGIVGRTTLKPRESLCELFYLFVLGFILFTSKLPLAQQKYNFASLLTFVDMDLSLQIHSMRKQGDMTFNLSY